MGKTKAERQRLNNLGASGLLAREMKGESERVAGLRLQLQALREECTQLNNEVVNRTSEKCQLNSKVCELRYQCGQLEQRANEYALTIQTKNADIRLKNDTMLQLNGQMMALSNKETKMKTSIINLKKQLEDGRQEKKQSVNVLSSLKTAFKASSSEVTAVDKKVKALQARIRKKRKIISGHQVSGCDACGKTRWDVFTFSKRKAMSRQRRPYSHDLGLRTRRNRSQELFKIVKFCAGSDKLPSLNLLLDTAVKYFDKDRIFEVLNSSDSKCIRSVRDSVVSTWNKSYFHSRDNKLRSVAVMYAKNVMSKRKWNSMRITGERAGHQGQKIVNVLPYERVMEFINEIEMGTVSNLTELDPSIGVRVGRFRDLKTYACRLASFYLNVYERREDDLLIFKTVPKLCATLPRGGVPIAPQDKNKADICHPHYMAKWLPSGRLHQDRTFLSSSSWLYNKLQQDSVSCSSGNVDTFQTNFVRENAEELIEAEKKKLVQSTTFDMLFGGDGAPAVGTVFLLGFVNVGQRLGSSKEAFLIFGADVEETADIIDKYLRRVVADFGYLEDNVFIVKAGDRLYAVEFRVGGNRSDMKMLCYLAGEVGNSATFFTTFCNIFKTGNAHLVPHWKNGVDWKPFTYEKRVRDGILAEKKLKEMKKKGGMKAKTLKANMATHAAELGGRQVCRPRLGKYIDKTKADPLHIKNNVCFDVFVRFWILIYGGTDVGKDIVYDDLVVDQPDHVLVRLVQFVKKDMRLNKLSTKMIKWCNETRGNIETGFQYRFRGEESNAFLDKFPDLVNKFVAEKEGIQRRHMFQLFYLCILLRKMISYACRLTDFNKDILSEMEIAGRRLYMAGVRFGSKISPSLWVLTNSAIDHARETLETYGLGLGVTSMESCEQKHQVIARFNDNATPQDKWDTIMRHDFMASIYLRENGFDETKYVKSKHRYLPVPDETKCENCGLALEWGQCWLCSDLMYSAVVEVIDSQVEKYDVRGEEMEMNDERKVLIAAINHKVSTTVVVSAKATATLGKPGKATVTPKPGKAAATQGKSGKAAPTRKRKSDTSGKGKVVPAKLPRNK